MNCDDKGLIWPHEVSPADVHIVATGKASDPQLPAAEQLAAACEAAGIRVLLDDRVGVSPGIKFNDAELIGTPIIVVVGRGLPDGLVEVKDRRSGERRDVPLADVVAELRATLTP
jgi:prolyl-tRNA synthetase